MFHALGYLHATVAMTLGTTLILRRKFRLSPLPRTSKRTGPQRLS